MKTLEYLTPENQIALWIVYVLLGLFAVWLGLLLWNLWRHLRYRGQIKRCKDLSSLKDQDAIVLNDTTESSLALRQGIEEAFRSFQLEKGLGKRSPIGRHLWSIFEAGCNESQLDARGLIKNTTEELFRANGLQRSLLSIFIILGLLGTLFGLADTLASLDTLIHGTTKLNNDILGQSLQRLLGTLKSAFAPSIWGVSLTVLGVLIFAFYLRVVALPLGGLLERMTLTVWVPQLVPTVSQKLLTKLQLTERQMQRSFEAAQQVAEFAESIKEKTGDFGQTVSGATKTLRQMTKVSGNLETFSKNFIDGVQVLTPFQQDLRSLYQQLADGSRTFHQSVQSNITDSKEFQKHTQEQLSSQHQQLAQVLKGLQSYEAAYVSSRERIDKKLGAVLVEAEKAFQSLGNRNAEIAAALDEGLGRPLRENLAQNLDGIQTALHQRLGDVRESLQVQLGSFGEKMARLDAPINLAAQNFSDTFSNFNETTRGLLEKLQREFANQNETNQQQLQRLESLSKNIPTLLETLSKSSKDFSETSGSFATHGQKLSTDVTTLSQNISDLAKSVDSLKEQVSPKKPVSHPDGAQQRMVELIGQQMVVLQQLGRQIDGLTSAYQKRREAVGPTADTRSPQPPVVAAEMRWRDRLRSLLTGRP